MLRTSLRTARDVEIIAEILEFLSSNAQDFIEEGEVERNRPFRTIPEQ